MSVQKEGEPMVVRTSLLSIQVCVPELWTDEQALEYAEQSNPCGTQNGWLMRKDGDKSLAGDPERRQCVEHDSHVHITLDA